MTKKRITAVIFVVCALAGTYFYLDMAAQNEAERQFNVMKDRLAALDDSLSLEVKSIDASVFQASAIYREVLVADNRGNRLESETLRVSAVADNVSSVSFDNGRLSSKEEVMTITFDKLAMEDINVEDLQMIFDVSIGNRPSNVLMARLATLDTGPVTLAGVGMDIPDHRVIGKIGSLSFDNIEHGVIVAPRLKEFYLSGPDSNLGRLTSIEVSDVKIGGIQIVSLFNGGKTLELDDNQLADGWLKGLRLESDGLEMGIEHWALTDMNMVDGLLSSMNIEIDNVYINRPKAGAAVRSDPEFAPILAMFDTLNTDQVGLSSNMAYTADPKSNTLSFKLGLGLKELGRADLSFAFDDIDIAALPAAVMKPEMNDTFPDQIINKVRLVSMSFDYRDEQLIDLVASQYGGLANLANMLMPDIEGLAASLPPDDSAVITKAVHAFLVDGNKFAITFKPDMPTPLINLQHMVYRGSSLTRDLGMTIEGG